MRILNNGLSGMGEDYRVGVHESPQVLFEEIKVLWLNAADIGSPVNKILPP